MSAHAGGDDKYSSLDFRGSGRAGQTAAHTACAPGTAGVPGLCARSRLRTRLAHTAASRTADAPNPTGAPSPTGVPSPADAHRLSPSAVEPGRPTGADGIRLGAMSPVFDATTPEGLADALPKVVAGVREGRLVVLPTDTVYGVGADAFSREAVAGLLAAKGRGREMPPPVLIAKTATVDGLATDVPDYARALIERYWPGPLTLVLQAQPSLAWDLGETRGTVALRMPDDDIALAILADIGPMAVSSANRTGNPASRTVVEAAAQLGAAVTYYLDGGPSRGGLASTIVDCTGLEPVILREGALAADDILAVVAAARANSAPDGDTAGSVTPVAAGAQDAVAPDPTSTGDAPSARDDDAKPPTADDPLECAADAAESGAQTLPDAQETPR